MSNQVEALSAGLARRAVSRCFLFPAAVLLCQLLPLASWSQETRNIGGEKFTVHLVEQGQTLFAISRAFAVPVDELLKANPAAKDGLRSGQELLIPQAAVMKKEARQAPALLKDGELKHIVAKKETLFGVAKKYGLDINDLLERNPELTSGMREGMEVIIPVKANDAQDPALRPAEASHTIDHVVQPGETLFSLGQRYGVKPEEIARANAGFLEGLKAGASMRIPQRGAAPAPPPVVASAPKPVSELRRIGLLLPFSAARNDSTLAATALTNEGERFHEASRIAAKFYAGALLALDSLAALGLNAEVRAIDVGDEPRLWSSALKDRAISDLDLSIGPFHRAAIEQLARANPRLPIVCPVPQSNKVVLGFANVSKAVPARADLVRHAARYVAVKHARENILFLRPEIAADKEMQESMLASLNAALADQSGRLRDTALVVKTGRRDIGDLAAKLDATRLNVIVAPTEDVEFTAMAVAKLKALAEKQRILVVGMESWLSMDPVSSPDLELIGFTFPAGSFTDPLDPRVQRFTEAYRQRWSTDADEYALLGYDVMMHEGLQILGVDGPAPLHMGFRMARTGPENGQRNEQGIMLRIRDLMLERAQ